ncbi:MAG: hypothetical protein WCO56_22545, partial [Verrucomicrobiota bacterium]
QNNKNKTKKHLHNYIYKTLGGRGKRLRGRRISPRQAAPLWISTGIPKSEMGWFSPMTSE